MKPSLKALVRAIGICASALMTLFACIFALSAISCLIMSVIQKDILSAILAVFCGVVAAMIWSVRRDLII